MPRAAILHLDFSVIGGAERLALDIARALSLRGWEVDIYTMYLNVELLDRIHGSLSNSVSFRPVRKPLKLKVSDLALRGRGVRLRRLLLYSTIIDVVGSIRDNYDLVFETLSNMPFPVDISYLHYAGLLDYDWAPSTGAGAHSTLKEIYSKMIRKYALRVARQGTPLVALTNSTWTRRLIERVYGIRADILYPAVDVEFFASCKSNRRENLVVTVARFEPAKNLESILDVASRVNDYRFVIVGSMQGLAARRYFERLKEAIEAKGLSGRVELRPNLERNKLRELLCRARFYLHPKYREHFGIAVAEAMAAGAVPIVYRDGGAWSDIVRPLDESLGYMGAEEAAEIILRVGSDPARWARLSRRAVLVASRFSFRNFAEGLMVYVERASRWRRSREGG